MGLRRYWRFTRPTMFVPSVLERAAEAEALHRFACAASLTASDNQIFGAAEAGFGQPDALFRRWLRHFS
jgi:hypothetical protein